MDAFKSKKISVPVSEKIGSVSALIIAPDSCDTILLLAHGAGAGMTHRFMELLSVELASRGIGTIRYNFPYMERGQKRPDPPAIAEKTVSVMIEKSQQLFPTQKLLVGGKSFGGRMSSQCLSKTTPEFVKGVVFFGFPLHPAGAPAVTRAEHLSNVTIPMLFLQGTRDALAELSRMENVCGQLPTSRLVKFEGADHSFKAGKKEFISELAEATEEWAKKLK